MFPWADEQAGVGKLTRRLIGDRTWPIFEHVGELGTGIADTEDHPTEAFANDYD